MKKMDKSERPRLVMAPLLPIVKEKERSYFSRTFLLLDPT